MNTIYFVSLGCPKNRVDTEVMLGEVAQAGYRIVVDPQEAETIVVNTCGFIDPAKEESIDTILEMTRYKEEGTCNRLVVTGCLTQRHATDVARSIPEIDDILGSTEFSQIVSVLQNKASVKEPLINVTSKPTYIYDHNSPRLRTGLVHSAYLKIAEGCDRPCAFCIIPKLRGAQRSRPIDSIVAEAHQLAAQGVVEINLIAQDLTRYGVDLKENTPTLTQLLRALNEVEGISWIRLHYTYPSAFTDELIQAIADCDRVANYIDVPLQHIDNAMLKQMRRGHSASVTYKLIDRLRQGIPNVVLRTTFIAGHPGESQEAFERLEDFIKEIEFDHVGVFPYSREDGTVAAMLPKRVPEGLAQERRDRLMEIQKDISRRKQAERVGMSLDVLIDEVNDSGSAQGRWFGQAIDIDGIVSVQGVERCQPGQIVQAKIIESSDYDLTATI